MALREAGEEGVVIAGPRLAQMPAGVFSAWMVAPAARFAYVSRRANDRGALVAGVVPQLLPGGRAFANPQERGEVEALWGPIMAAEEGRDWRGILQACANREIDVLFLIGVDPLRDYPDAALALRALQNVPTKVVQSLELGSLEPFADAFLPAAPFLEKDGHVTTWEGRSQRLRPVRGPEGIALPDWEIFASLGLAAGGDLGFETLDELRDEMGRLLAPRELGGSGFALPGSSVPVVPEGNLILFSYPLLVDEGRLSERAEELKAVLQDEAFVEVHPQDAAAFGLTRRGPRDGPHRGGRGGAARPRQPRTSRRAPRSCPSISRGSQRTPFFRARSRRPRPSSRSHERPSPRGCRRGELGRLGHPRCACRHRVLRHVDRRDDLHLDGTQGHRGHADA